MNYVYELDFTDTFCENFTVDVLDALDHGRSCLVKGIAHDGRSMYFRYLSLHAKKRSADGFSWRFYYFDATLWYSHDPDRIVDVFCRTLSCSSFDEISNMLEIHFTHSLGVAFIFDHISEKMPDILVRLLKYLRGIYKKNIRFIFCLSSENSDNFDYLGELEDISIESQLLFPFMSQVDFEQLFAIRNALVLQKNNLSVSNLWELSGGHPGLAKRILFSTQIERYMKDQDIRCFLQDNGVLRLSKEIFLSISLQDREALVSDWLNFKAEFRIPLGRLISTNPLWRDLWVYYLSQAIEVQGQDILVASIRVTNLFSKSQLQSILLLLNSRGQVVRRELLAQRLWKKKADTKYSDWAIDKLMSDLRKILPRFGLLLTTVSGVGYRLE